MLCRLQARYPTRSVRGFAKLTRGTQGVVVSFWPDDMLEGGGEGEEGEEGQGN